MKKILIICFIHRTKSSRKPRDTWNLRPLQLPHTSQYMECSEQELPAQEHLSGWGSFVASKWVDGWIGGSSFPWTWRCLWKAKKREANFRGYKYDSKGRNSNKVERCYDLNVRCPSCAENWVPADTAIVGGCRNFDVGPSLRKWRLGFEGYSCPWSLPGFLLPAHPHAPVGIVFWLGPRISRAGRNLWNYALRWIFSPLNRDI